MRGSSDIQFVKILSRESKFSYTCNGCGRCCRTMKIRVSDVDVERLAANRQITPKEFIDQFTREDGTALKTQADGACIFLNDNRCEVYEFRPLVCRLYPLARHVDENGVESFCELTPDPETKGVYGKSGTVGEYLAKQGIYP